MTYWLSAIKESYGKQRPIWVAVLIVFVLGIIPRFITIDAFLPEYSIDENEIVEFPLGFFGGDKDPLWFKYGPFYWYLLYYVFKVQAFFSGMSPDGFVENYFVNNVSYYTTARIFNSCIHIALGFLGFMICHKHVNRNAAPYVLLIALFPFVDMFTSFKPRVDSLLALCALISLYFALDWLKERKNWSYVLAGLFFGFSVSSKPLPALLLLPTLSLIYIISEIEQIQKDKKRKLNFGSVAQALFVNKALYLALGSAILGFILSNPYAAFDLGQFYQEQIYAIETEGGRDFESGASMNKFFVYSGYAFTIAAVISIFVSIIDSIKRKKWGLMAISSYILIFYAAFAMGASREYFYIPIIPLCALLVAYYIHRLVYYLDIKSEKLQISLKLLLALVVFGQPLKSMAVFSNNVLKVSGDYAEVVPSLAAGNWIMENVPTNSKILYYGYYTSLPRLLDSDPNEQASYGDYFMYNRNKNKYWIERFSSAMNTHVQNGGITYDIVYQLNASVNGANKQFYTRYQAADLDPVLFKTAASNGIFYVVSHYPLDLGDSNFELAADFSAPKYTIGLPVQVYRIEK